MRPSQWNRLCNPIEYRKIPGLFEAFPPFQKMKTAGVLTEFGKAPSLRGPRKQYKKSVGQENKKRRANDDGEGESEVEGQDSEVECQDSEDEDFISDTQDVDEAGQDVDESGDEREQYFNALRMRSVGRRPGRPRIDPALKKKQPAPYLAADIKTRREPMTSEVMEKLKFFKWVKLTSPSDESEYYRVIAYAHQPMREAAWKKLFQALSVKKIEGYFEGYGPYLKIRDRNDQGPNCNWVGVPPACLRRAPEATELSELEGSDFSAESEDPINAPSDAAKPLKPELNYRNLEELALRFHKDHAVASDQLKDTLAAMYKAGWRFCNAVEERGLPGRYYEEFTAAVRGGTIYTPEYFEQMRVDQLVEARGRPRKRAWLYYFLLL
jgi:hypothetical protein